VITEIHAKTILNSVPQPDEWFGLKYNLNLYRGCQHYGIATRMPIFKPEPVQNSRQMRLF
jgi:hypothetical protein